MYDLKYNVKFYSIFLEMEPCLIEVKENIFTSQRYLKMLTFISKQITLKRKTKKQLKSGPGVIKLFSSPTQLSKKFIPLINVKIPTIVGILTIISKINTASERLKAKNFFICQYFSFNEQLKFRDQLS